MNKRAIITVLVSIFLVIGAFIGVIEYLSYKDVSLVFEKPNVNVSIYNSDDTKIGSFSNDTTIQLKEGRYSYAGDSENYSTEKIAFEVNGDQTVDISPAYSSNFLAELLSEEQATIRKVVSSKYPEVKSDFIIGDEQLAHYGEWYTAKFIQRVSGGNEPDVYRIVLEKENETWKVVIAPKLVLSIAENPSIPDYVIRQANEPLSNEAYALLYPE